MRTLLLILALPFSLWLGSNWNAASVPTQGATVYMQNGKELTGDVYRTFSGDYAVHTKNGFITQIPANAVTTVIHEQTPQSQFSFAVTNWRFSLPPLIVFAILGVEIAANIRSLTARQARREVSG